MSSSAPPKTTPSPQPLFTFLHFWKVLPMGKRNTPSGGNYSNPEARCVVVKKYIYFHKI